VFPVSSSRTSLIEGHPSFYIRKKIKLLNNENAWSYFLDFEKYKNYPKIKSGLWK